MNKETIYTRTTERCTWRIAPWTAGSWVLKWIGKDGVPAVAGSYPSAELAADSVGHGTTDVLWWDELPHDPKAFELPRWQVEH
jgi:hypothetical protein